MSLKIVTQFSAHFFLKKEGKNEIEIFYEK
jgi:hypothetical protein